MQPEIYDDNKLTFIGRGPCYDDDMSTMGSGLEFQSNTCLRDMKPTG